ncbi:myrcene synthase, chloroplastic-like [Corylus avellana]|uniref:myrcene synthase, chloroplastic-like n=1 Tax=Corylus avellana TaxID=13451 RepID=UPI00286CE5E4|nr:myrcene synthase, chloroplastic-like [Corylus avellana]
MWPFSMALHLLASVHHCNLTGLLPFKRPNAPVISRNGNVPRPNSKCMATNEISVSNGGSTVRRSANYQPSIWHYNYIQSLTSEYVGESCTRQLDELKGEVRMMFHKVVEPGEQLELIDILQRLGLSYHFEDEIRSTLEGVYMNTNHGICNKERNLYTTALGFRLLRQNGFSVPQDIFNSFTNDKGNLEESLGEDTKGMLSLYEASFLLREGESMLEEAGDFATRKLKEYLKQNISEDQNLSSLVRHALELPLHWRMIRLEVRWFIDIYRSREDMNPILLELAELDFNMVQAVHQEDLKQLSRWWRRTGLGEKLSFARDRLMENFLWTVGKAFEPQFGYCRRTLTKVNALITVIDEMDSEEQQDMSFINLLQGDASMDNSFLGESQQAPMSIDYSQPQVEVVGKPKKAKRKRKEGPSEEAVKFMKKKAESLEDAHVQGEEFIRLEKEKFQLQKLDREENINIEKRMLHLQELDREERIMMLDTSRMSDFQQQYWMARQKEIIEIQESRKSAQFASGSVVIYIFLYSINYLVFDLKSLSGAISATLYLGYSLFMVLAIMLATGIVGFLSSFWFVHYLFSSVKLD